MRNLDITIVDNSPLVKEELQRAILRALERCGSKAEEYAVNLCPVSKEGYGGTLKGSISHKVDEDKNKAYVGTNNEYAAYVELGTGKYYPGGRDTPWNYQDDEGNWHHTEGQKAQPYLKPAVANHVQTYRNIIKDELQGK